MIARVVAVVVLLHAVAAHAAEPSPEALEEAREQFARGSEAYAQGRYDEALTAFERAYARAALPTLLPNIAACQEKLGQDAAAAETLRRYLATDAVKDRAAVTAQLHAIEARLLPSPAPSVSPAPAPERSRVPRLRRAVVGSGIATGVLGLTAGALTIAAAARYHDLAGDCHAGAGGCSASAADRLTRLDAAADAMWALTGAAAITTITLHLVLRHERQKLRATIVADR
jgi:tetratricopeptide (TPR) repeat protein